MEPKGRHVIKVCTGTACYVKGIREVISRISNKYDMEEGCTTEDRCFSLESVVAWVPVDWPRSWSSASMSTALLRPIRSWIFSRNTSKAIWGVIIFRGKNGW